VASLLKSRSSFAQLKRKYQGFQAPTIKILIENVEINENLSAVVQDLTIDLTSEYHASGCVFIIQSAYLEKESKFSPKLADKLIQLGCKVSVAIGYVKTETVFQGYITQISYIFDNETESPSIKVECIDAKGLLMKNQRLQIFKEEKVSGAIEGILSQQPYSSYISGKTIENSLFNEDIIRSNMETDYEFIVRQAKRTGYEFFILQNSVYFRKTPTSETPVLKISHNEELISAEINFDANSLVNKIEVRSIDTKNNEVISAIAKSTAKFSKGQTVSRLCSGTSKIFFEPDLKSKDEAQKRAKIILEQHENMFGKIECKCIGIPEIVPGRFIKIDGLMPQGNLTYYITNVKHELNSDGFQTFFEARVNQL